MSARDRIVRSLRGIPVVERRGHRLEHYRDIAGREDKTAASCEAAVSLAASLLR